MSKPDRLTLVSFALVAFALFVASSFVAAGDGKISCAQCHQTMFYGTDALALAVGSQGKIVARNVPTVLNTVLQFFQHYGGNRVDVEEQAVKANLAHLGKAYSAQPRLLPGRAPPALVVS